MIFQNFSKLPHYQEKYFSAVYSETAQLHTRHHQLINVQINDFQCALSIPVIIESKQCRRLHNHYIPACIQYLDMSLVTTKDA